MVVDFLPIDGRTVAVNTAGRSHLPTLLMIHGYLSSHHVWRYLVPRLQARFFCVGVDLIGYGGSDKPDDPEPYRIASQAQTCLRVLEALGRSGQFSVIGHSMGGKIAMELASITAPQRVQNLINVAGVVSDGLPLIRDHALPQIERTYRYPVLEALLRPFLRAVPSVARYSYGAWFYRPQPFANWRLDREMASLPNIRFGLRHSWDAMCEDDLTPRLRHITARTLTIFGEQDAVVSVDEGFKVKQALPDSTLMLLPECGHFPMYEVRKPFEQAVLRWLNVG